VHKTQCNQADARQGNNPNDVLNSHGKFLLSAKVWSLCCRNFLDVKAGVDMIVLVFYADPKNMAIGANEIPAVARMDWR